MSHLPLLRQPLLFDHLEDCKNVHKVFLIVPTGVDGHAEVGRVGKLDLEDLGFFLGCDNVNLWNIRNGWPCCMPLINVPYKRTFGAPDQGQTLDV